MDKALDKELYMKVKKESDKVFEKHSLYKSMWILKEYKKRGGKYKDKKPIKNKNKLSGSELWLKSQWIQVLPFLEKGEIIPCGESNKQTKACRPTVKINNETPLTIKELLKIHGKEKLIEIAKKKNNNMNKRMNWKTGKFY